LSLLPDQKKSEDALSMAATFDIQPSAAYRNYDSIKKGMEDKGMNLHKKAFMSGIGKTYATAGQTMKWLGAEDQADVYGDFGKRLQRAYSYPVNQEDISWKNLSDSNWWATNVTSSIPFTLSLIPAAVLAAYAGGATATAIGWGAFGKTVLGSFMAAGVSRPMESALEAGGVYEEEFNRSGDEEKANEAANTAFKMNMYLGGMDIAEFAIAFTPLRVLGKSANKSLMRRILATGGKLAATGGMEAGEEAIQSGIEQYSLGDEIDFGKMKTPAFVGGLFGVGMGGTGSVYTALRDKVIDTMPPDMNSIVNDAIQGGLESGLPQQQAELKALDEIADTPEGKAHIEQVMETLKDPTKEVEPIAKEEKGEKVAPEPTSQADPLQYKSAEEFVAGQTKVYHGSGVSFENFDPSFRGSVSDAKSASKAIFFTDSKDVAQAYGVYAAETGVVSAELKKADEAEKRGDWDAYDEHLRKAEELDTYDKSLERRKEVSIKEVVLSGDFMEVDAGGKTPQELSEDENIDSWLSDQLKQAKRLKKDGVIFHNLDDAVGLYDRPATHYAVFSEKSIKTKAQLTDIWNKAQEKKVVKKPVVGGFTAKEILDRRRTSIRTIRDYFGLTDYELRQITKRDIRLMSNKEFKEFKDNIEIKAQKISERKQSVNELEALRKEKMFKSEDNIRKLHKLPTIKNMTKEQVDEYVSILSSYEKGDQFLTPKRIDILDNTIWKGSATIREVLEKASKEFDVPISDLKKIVVNELDRFRYDTPLARQNAFYNFMVDTIKINELRTKIKYFEAREELYRLGKKALASRERGLVGKLIPKQKEVMAYIEAEDADKVILATELTPEEMELANYIQEFYQKAYNYLLINQDLKSSRFADDKYVFHSKRPISELLVDIKETGVKSAISDLLNRWKLDETHFQILDSKTGEILGMRKFFRQTLFRTGELTPSQNIIKSTETYMQQFFNKMALDESVPTIETLAIALRPQEKTKNGMLLNDTLMTFVKQYLNNKKGRVINVAGINQGGKIDTAIRFANNLVSLNYIALNIPLEVAAVVGETTAKTVALGPKKLILANQRKLTKQGRKILEKYKPFTGEGVLEEFFQPARNIGENVNLLMYGLFSWNRKITKQDILLGNMTREEFEKGEINQERLAEVTKMTGRWVDMEGVKSVVGSTSTGGALTKFKGWAIPIVSSTLNDITSLTRSITGMGDKSKRLTKMQAWELLRIAEIGMVVVAVAALVGEDEDRSTFTGKLKFYAIRELTTVFNALSPTLILSVGVTVAFLESLAKNLWLLMTLEEYKTKPGYKGAAALKKQFTPAAIGQFKSEGKQPTYKSRFD